LSKCRFAHDSVNFVGHVIGSGNKSADNVKIDAIMSMSPPNTKKKWQSFIGMVNYYREYIPNMSELLVPLTELTRKNSPSNTVNDVRVLRAFDDLKRALCSTTVLRTAKYDRDFLIQCDASNYAVGACLAQVDDEGHEHPICFASSKLSDTQQKWSTIEKEGYAIIFALKKFDHVVYGNNIVIYSDHNPLHFLSESVPKSSKLTRWSLALQRYNIKIVHRPGVDNGNADALSRVFN
jgi:hypothetical protein